MNAATLEWLLRGFGVAWIVGSGIAFHKAREAALIDKLLGALSGTPEDPLVTRFQFVGSALTLASGVGLVLATAWALVPLGLLVASQLVYFALVRRKRARAQTPETREEARVQPATRRAFWLSLLVTFATGVAVWLGRFSG
ncbi:hypothetical protein N790_12885 [Arenimonas malthae CC-JY-1]|uniref:Uncharacterized protein n=1 Tax=Arenimonas malthae CC-JY-1 TaxID=1384054 RepID=A0A091BJZ6_9GAMM|nr:hypothetical protein [Arenimonas malthae]KFN52091.1 hypothetical protein N790_12885 [Arenimonas malthae CC-JY-1]